MQTSSGKCGFVRIDVKRKLLEKPIQHILFVCGRNQKRSPTAATVFRNSPGVEVRSAGVSEKSHRRVTENDVIWADIILVMETKYQRRIREQFRHLEELPAIHSLDIPDDYEYMDDSLVAMLENSVPDFFAS